MNNENLELAERNQNLLELTVRLGNENQKLKEGMTEMAGAAYNAVFEAGKYGESIGSKPNFWSCYAAYGRVGKIYGKFISKREEDKDSLLWGDANI